MLRWPAQQDPRIIRVGIDVSVLDRTTTGTATYVRELMRAMAVSDETIEFVRLRGPKPVRGKGLRTKLTNLLLELAWLHVILPARAYQTNVSLLHMPANTAPVFAPCPVVTTIHDANFCRFPGTYDLLYRKYARMAFTVAALRSRYVIADSHHTAKDVVKYFHALPDRVVPIHLGISPPFPPAAEGLPSDATNVPPAQPYFLFVGQTEPHKNLLNLVEAFAIARVHPTLALQDMHLVIAGPPGRVHVPLVAKVHALGLSSCVALPGRVSPMELEALYVGASALVFPSLAEGFGFPPLEAMARGIPVLVSHAGSLPEIVGNSGLYCDPHSVQAIADGMVEIIGNLTLRARLSRLGLRRSQDFTWHRTSVATSQVYRRTLGP